MIVPFPEMKHSIHILAVIVLVTILAACHSKKQLYSPRYQLMDTLKVSARNNPIDIYRASSPKVWEILLSDVELHFDFSKKQAAGLAKLHIQAYALPADTLVLDAKDMQFHSVSYVNNQGMKMPLSFTNDSLQVRIPVKGLDFGSLNQPKEIEFDLDYTAMPYNNEVGGSAAISEDRGLYFINTDHEVPGKPVQIWTQGETESNSHWLPTIDKPNQRTKTKIQLLVPDTMQTLSNGHLIRSTNLENGLRKDEWTMDQPIQVYAIMFAIGHFAISKEMYQDPSGASHEVRYYTEPVFGPYAKGMFRGTPDMIRFFSEVTGVPYPWDTYSQVVVRDYVSGAMENTSASLFGEFVNQDARQLIDGGSEDVVSHELFHQWFGDYVTAESWSNLTLNESFATFGEQLWRKHHYGLESVDELAYNDLNRYLDASDRDDPALVRFYYFDRERMFDRVSYQKGGSILRYIQWLAGDTLFSRAMKLYLTKNALHAAEASQWRLALEEATGKDWMLFFNQWYYRGGHPVLKVHYDYNDQEGVLKVSVHQMASPDSSQKYNLVLETAVIGTNSRKTVPWLITERNQTFTYPYENGIRPLVIPDAPHVLPGIIVEDKPIGEWFRQIQLSDNFISKRQAITAAMISGDQQALQILEAGLSDRMAGIREFTLNQIVRASANRQGVLKPKVVYILQTDGNNKVRAAAMEVAGNWKLRSELPELMGATRDSSYLLAGSALDAIRMMELDSAYRIARQLQDSDPKGALLNAVWMSISGKGDPSDIDGYERISPGIFGSKKVLLSINLSRYAINVKDDAIFVRTLQLIQQEAQSENQRNNRHTIGSNLLNLVKYYKEADAKYGKSDGQFKKRLDLVEKQVRQLMDAESDPVNKKRYKEQLEAFDN